MPGLRTLLALALAAPWVGWALARLVGLDAVGHPVAAAISFTPYVALTAPVPVLVALALRRWSVAALAATAALVLALAVVPRAVGGPQPSSDRADGPVVTVMTANLLGGGADVRRVVELVRREGVDVLSAQELTPASVRRLDRAGLSRLLPHRVLDARPRAAGTGLYAREPLRRLPPAPTEPGQAAQPRAALTAPPLLLTAVHPRPPITPAAARVWRRSLAALPAAAQGRTPSLLLGDFNATLDHRALRRVLDRGYVDAADAAGEGLTPTWGFRRRVLPVTIDHVLVDERVRVRRVEVHAIPETDHRAVVAELALPPDGS